jgi:hypothetical protein
MDEEGKRLLMEQLKMKERRKCKSKKGITI